MIGRLTDADVAEIDRSTADLLKSEPWRAYELPQDVLRLALRATAGFRITRHDLRENEDGALVLRIACAMRASLLARGA